MLDVAIEVHALLKARAPHAAWDIRLVTHAVHDFAELDVLEVAGRCALYLHETPGARNGNRTFRTFLERERADRNQQVKLNRQAERLADYDRTRNP